MPARLRPTQLRHRLRSLRLRGVLLFFLLTALTAASLSACTGVSAPPTAAAPPAAPAPAAPAIDGALAQLEQLHTAPQQAQIGGDEGHVFAPDTLVAGIDLSGMDVPTARAYLLDLQNRLSRPLDVELDGARTTIYPDEISLQLPIEAMLSEARTLNEQGQPVRIPVQISYDTERLRQKLQNFANDTMILPTLHVLTDTDSIGRSFGYTPGQRINVEVALYQIDRQLAAPLGVRRITLTRSPDPTIPAPRATPQQIQEQLELLAAEWDGVVGLYLHDLASNTTVATLNERTVFSGASLLKVPIMLHAHMTLQRFTPEQYGWITAMILDSDNQSANDLLAASVGGRDTEDALIGVQLMNEHLQQLGLNHTYQLMPYEAYDYLVGVLGMEIPMGPEYEGEPPYTFADPVIRTTPGEMGHLFVLMDRCKRGYGDLMTMFPDTITPTRCRSMLDLLTKNHDLTRMVAGIPAGVRVEHKSGWVDQMQCDVGIVRSPAGDYVLALYIYQEEYYADSSIADPFLATLSHLVYTAYNPVLMDADE